MISQRLAKNTLWLTLSNVGGRLLISVAIIFIARILGDELYGRYSFLIDTAAIFIVFADFGLSTLTTRDVARDKNLASKYLGNITVIKIFLSLLSAALMVVLGFILGKDIILIKLMALMGCWVIFNAYQQFFCAIFRAFEKMVYEAIALTVDRIFFIIVCFFILYLPWIQAKLFYLILATVVAMFFASLVAYYFTLKRFTAFKLQIDNIFIKKIFKLAWPFALSTIFFNVYFNLDSIMLSAMKTDEVVGWYNAGYRIIFFILILGNTIRYVIFPTLSSLIKENKEKFTTLIRYVLKIIISLIVPITVGGIFLAPLIIESIFGSEYLAAIPSFQLLLVSCLIIFINLIYGTNLESQDRQKNYTISIGLGVLLNFILNLILIPKFSLNGAALTTVLSQILILFFVYYQSKKVLTINFWPLVIKPLIASLLMLGCLYLIENLISQQILNLIISIISGSIIYLAIMILIKGIDRTDWLRLKNLLINCKGN